MVQLLLAYLLFLCWVALFPLCVAISVGLLWLLESLQPPQALLEDQEKPE